MVEEEEQETEEMKLADLGDGSGCGATLR